MPTGAGTAGTDRGDGADVEMLGEGRWMTRKNAGQMLPMMQTFGVSKIDLRDIPLAVLTLYEKDSRKRLSRFDVSYRIAESLPDFGTLFFTSRKIALESRTFYFWSEVLVMISFVTLMALSAEYGLRATTLDFAPREHCGQQASWHRAFFTFGCVAVGSMVASSAIAGYPCGALIEKKENDEDDEEGEMSHQEHQKGMGDDGSHTPSRATKGDDGKDRTPRCRESCLKIMSTSRTCRMITAWFFNMLLGVCLLMLFTIAIWGIHIFWQKWSIVYVNHRMSSATTYCDPWGTPLGYIADLYLIALTFPLVLCVFVCPLLDIVWVCPSHNRAGRYCNRWVLRCFKNCMQRYKDVTTKEIELREARENERKWKNILRNRESSTPQSAGAYKMVFRASRKLLRAHAQVALAAHSFETEIKKHPTGDFFQRLQAHLPVHLPNAAEAAKTFIRSTLELEKVVKAETESLREAFENATGAALSSVDAGEDQHKVMTISVKRLRAALEACKVEQRYSQSCSPFVEAALPLLEKLNELPRTGSGPSAIGSVQNLNQTNGGGGEGRHLKDSRV